MGAPPDQKRIQKFISECMRYERPPVFIPGLSPTHNVILAMLLRGEDKDPTIVPLRALKEFCGSQGNLNVTMSKLRKRLPNGVKIHNIHNTGFYISTPDREKLRKMFST